MTEQTVTAAAENRKLLELTDRGRTYVETHLDLEMKHRGRGGIVHRFWQHRLKEVFEDAGWPAKRELFDADVYVNLGDMELTIEVAMGNNEREVKHVQQHLENGFDAVWIICRNETVRDGLRERLAERGLLTDRVTVRLVNDISGAENRPLP